VYVVPKAVRLIVPAARTGFPWLKKPIVSASATIRRRLSALNFVVFMGSFLMEQVIST
jgi:hypothetical protein